LKFRNKYFWYRGDGTPTSAITPLVAILYAVAHMDDTLNSFLIRAVQPPAGCNG